MSKFTIRFKHSEAKADMVSVNDEALIMVEGEGIELSDEYHSMHDLYEHRMALNVALFNLLGRMDKQIGVRTVVKSLLHKDGTMFEGGYFIVMYTPKQISYHYHLKHWDKFQIPEVERIPVEYDGHTAHDVIERLLQL